MLNLSVGLSEREVIDPDVNQTGRKQRRGARRLRRRDHVLAVAIAWGHKIARSCARGRHRRPRRRRRLGERRLAASRTLPDVRPDAPNDSADVIAICSNETIDLPAA